MTRNELAELNIALGVMKLKGPQFILLKIELTAEHSQLASKIQAILQEELSEDEKNEAVMAYANEESNYTPREVSMDEFVALMELNECDGHTVSRLHHLLNIK